MKDLKKSKFFFLNESIQNLSLPFIENFVEEKISGKFCRVTSLFYCDFTSVYIDFNASN
jgi:hypothetical protein